MAEPHVSVIIATWNAADVLGACLDSLARQEVGGGFETIVVDNASTDTTEELLARYEHRVRVISNRVNAFYAGANNQAARVARGRVLFFLNADTNLLGDDVLEQVARTAEEPGVGIAGPVLVNSDGTLQPSCGRDPSVWRALVVGAGLHRLAPDRARAVIAPEHWSHCRAIDTDWLMGAALAVRADVFREVGGFWDAVYAEEQDLAYRVRQKGFRVRFEPSARVVHIGNHSTAKRWSDAERAALVAAAELAFLRCHYASARALAIRAITGCAYGVRALAFRILGRDQRARVYGAMARAYATRGGARRVGPAKRRPA